MPLNIDWQQILLHLLNFVILFAILYFLLYKPVKDFMQKRMDYYKNLDEEAKNNLEKAQEQKQLYEDKIANIEEEINNTKKDAFKKTEEMSKEAILNAQNEAKKIISAAKEKAQKEYTKIINDAQSEIEGMVIKATQKLVHKQDTEVFDEFLESVSRGEADE